jgi:phosphatidylserine decarboxylase
MVFESVNEATRLWIKGREFTVTRLLGDPYKGQAERYHGGAVAIFRLAPQDYHRIRKIVPIDSTSFGRVMAVCAGAMTVGSIETTTVQEGQQVKRGQEFGYFAFGAFYYVPRSNCVTQLFSRWLCYCPAFRKRSCRMG